MADLLLTRLTKVIIFVVFFAVGIAGFFLGNPAQKFRVNEDEVCRVGCANQHKFHRLVPALPPAKGAPGKYDGPWNCECY